MYNFSFKLLKMFFDSILSFGIIANIFLFFLGINPYSETLRELYLRCLGFVISAFFGQISLNIIYTFCEDSFCNDNELYNYKTSLIPILLPIGVFFLTFIIYYSFFEKINSFFLYLISVVQKFK